MMEIPTSELPDMLALGVVFTTGERQRLPPFLGCALHGALGRALYRTVCAFPQRAECPGCPLYRRCAYPALMEAPVSENAALREAGVTDQAPRPLVLAPEPGWTRPSGNPVRLDAGCEVPVRLVLVGSAIRDLPVLTVALQALARRGIGLPEEPGATPGRRRAELVLSRISTADGAHLVYDAAGDAFAAPPVSALPAESVIPDRVVIDLLTPLRLKHAGAVAGSVEPEPFLAALARRANAFRILYGDGEAAVDEAAVARLAATIVPEESRLRRVHVTRYSARQQRRMDWPGMMGAVRWRGPALRPLWPLLRFGELAQVGKATSFGFGRYEVRPDVEPGPPAA